LLDLRPSEQDDEERALLEIAERGLDELHGESIAPLHVFQGDHGGMGRALCPQPVEKRQGDLLAHDAVVTARRRERRALCGGKRNAGELTEKFTDALPLPWIDVLAQLAVDRRSRGLGLVAAAHARVAAQRVAEERVRRAGVQRISVAGQERGRGYRSATRRTSS